MTPGIEMSAGIRTPAIGPGRPGPGSVLLVSASPRGAESETLQIAETFLDAYAAADPDARIDRLDVFGDLAPFGRPHAAAKMAVIAGAPVPDRAVAEWRQVQQLGARVRAADILLFAVPMWNGGIPWALKLFIDILTQPGIAFAFDPDTGYRGLLGGRCAVAVYASRVFVPGISPRFGEDFQSTYLRWWLAFCGIDDIHEVRLQPTFRTADYEARRGAAAERAAGLATRLARAEGAGASCRR